MLIDPWTDAPPDLRQLCRALGKCGVAANQIPQTVQQLTRPPLSLGQSAMRDTEMLSVAIIGDDFAKGQLVSGRRAFDGDTAARLLCLHKGRLDPGATWKALSYNERRQARRVWDRTPQGHPVRLDAALVLYCTRVLCEATGKNQFTFSRPPDGGKPNGPMWRALIEALPIAQRFLARRYQTPALTPDQIDASAESIAEIITLARSKEFAYWSQECLLGDRLALMYARKERRGARKSRPRKRRAKPDLPY